MQTNEQIQQAVTILNQGGIVIFPTDTAFGIGCKVSDEEAVKRLFHLRHRSPDKAIPVLVNSVKMAEKYTEALDENIRRKLLEPFWPGGLTIVLPVRKASISEIVLGGRKTVGLRMPNHQIPLEIIAGVGEGLATSSANFAGKPTPYAFAEIDAELVKLVDFIVSGETSAETGINCH